MIKSIVTGFLEVNTYLIENNKEVAVVDPGSDPNLIISEIENLGGNLKLILLTHGHSDHIGAVEALQEEYPEVQVLIHKDDEELLLDPELNMSPMVFRKPFTVKADRFLEEGDRIEFGDEIITVRHSPGHTPGGVVYLYKDNAFTGDSLFRGSIGRTDFYKGDQQTLVSSVREKILSLPDGTTLLPGHGPATTPEWERQHNPFI